jgi:hypothetical protein
MRSLATSPIDLPAWMRQVLQQRETYGLVINKQGFVSVAYNEDEVFGAPPNAQYSGYAWNTQNFSGPGVISIAANPQRKFLFIENNSTTPVAVSFGITAKYSATSPQGHILPGTVGAFLYADRAVPTNSIYIDLNVSGIVAVTQGVPGT